MMPGLGRCEDVTLLLDGAGTEKHMPVVFAGGEREGSRNREGDGASVDEPSVELRKAKVVADAQADAAERSFGNDHVRTRLDGL